VGGETVAVAADYVVGDGRARASLRWPVFYGPWLALGALTLASLAGIRVPETWRYAPLIASVVAFGLPHGAIDYVALPRAVAGEVTLRLVAAVSLLYAVVGAAYTLLWFLAPVPAAVLFILVTWFHWGQGELYPLVGLVGADHLDRPGRVATTVVRGGLPMLVPLLGFPDVYRGVVDSFVAPFGGTAADLAWLFTGETRLALGLGFGLLTVAVLARGYLLAGGSRGGSDTSPSGGRPWLVDAGETLLLWVYFLTVPPVFAIGVYFCLWHAVRHIARAVGVDRRAADSLRAGEVWGAFARFLKEALPLTALALVLFAGLWVAVPVEPTLREATGLYLVFIAILTLPHVVVVLWMDRAQGIWSPAAGS
jgi:Brp/Blh family beta-carotene 15,15'-monooxygenase